MLRAACFAGVIFPRAEAAPQPRGKPRNHEHSCRSLPKAAPESIRRTEPCQHKAGAEGQRAQGRPQVSREVTRSSMPFMPDAPFRIFAYNKTEAPWW